MTAAKPPTTAVILLNWNGADDTLECLESLATARPAVHVVVVDNHSTDDSVARIQASGLVDELIVNRTNLGFAEGNNVGIRFAMDHNFDIIVVLNNDTIATDGAMTRLARCVSESSTELAISPVIRYYSNPDAVWFEGGIVDRGWPRHMQVSEVPAAEIGNLRSSETLSGCCIAAHRSTWSKVGLFDASYYLIFEDSDWSARARRCGVELNVATDVEIHHKVSASFRGPSAVVSSYYFVRNGLRYVVTYHKRYTVDFVGRWLMRPTAARIVRRRDTDGLAFRWAGACAFLLRQRGHAPATVTRWAERSTQRRDSGQ